MKKKTFTRSALWMLTAVLLMNCTEQNEPYPEANVNLLIHAQRDAQVHEVVLSIQKVELKISGEWRTVHDAKIPFVFSTKDTTQATPFLRKRLPAGPCTEVRLTLDNSGNFCYTRNTAERIMLKVDNTLPPAAPTFTVQIEEGADIILEIDIVRSITKQGNGAYTILPVAALATRDQLCDIDGYFAEVDYQVYDEPVAVYLYPDGTFQGGASPYTRTLHTENFISSTMVEANGDFNFSCIPQGRYDLVMAALHPDGSWSELLGVYKGLNARAQRIHVSVEISL